MRDRSVASRLASSALAAGPAHHRLYSIAGVRHGDCSRLALVRSGGDTRSGRRFARPDGERNDRARQPFPRRGEPPATARRRTSHAGLRESLSLLTLNPPPPADQPLSYHNETPGAPGFTGVDRAHRSGPRSGTLDGNRWPRATHHEERLDVGAFGERCSQKARIPVPAV
jgi:hypothetical protein